MKYATAENFTSDFGLRFRRWISPAFRCILRHIMNENVHVVTRFPLEKDKPYIFAATHSCIADVIANAAYVDRSTYILVGTTDQIEHNPQMYGAWLNGLIYVNKLDSNSRKDAVKKMERVLKSGSSVLLFPEGSWNNTENLLVLPLFAGPWLLANRTGCEVVPIALRHEYKTKDIYISYGKSLALAEMEKETALNLLRDAMATLTYDLMEKCGTPLIRDNLGVNPRMAYMEERKNSYLQVKWSRDVWDEEITQYQNKNLPPSPQQVRAAFDNVQLTPQNAMTILPVLQDHAEDIEYDFIRFMHRNWNKKKEELL